MKKPSQKKTRQVDHQASLDDVHLAHQHVVKGTHNDKGNAEKHFKAMHRQVVGPKVKRGP